MGCCTGNSEIMFLVLIFTLSIVYMVYAHFNSSVCFATLENICKSEGCGSVRVLPTVYRKFVLFSIIMSTDVVMLVLNLIQFILC